MLCPTNYTVESYLLEEAIKQSDKDEFKLILNQPTGNFFYDPWVIKPEFIGTVWEDILNSLPLDKGEARIITLKPGTSYYSHADADDRWHLNLKSEYGFLCDLNNQQMHLLTPDGIWYDMDAGRIHSAVNFGHHDRVQLVVRQLLKSNVLKNPINIKIRLKETSPDYRYQFDRTISPWLNRANKKGSISNFKFLDTEVSFDIEVDELNSLKRIVPILFEIVE
jgi:hypothetical protein